MVCTDQGQDIVVAFQTNSIGDIHLEYEQTGDHAFGVYSAGTVYNYLCHAETGTCFAGERDNAGAVTLSGRPPGSYFVVIEANGYDGAGTIDNFSLVFRPPVP
jgi:hypothetical protein